MSDAAGDGAVAATDIQHGSALRNLRGQHFREDARAAFEDERSMPAPEAGKQPGSRCGCHSLFQIVVADKRPAANTQHAEKERSEDGLNAEEKPHGPEEYLTNLV